MANPALSNRERKAIRKAIPKAPRHAPGEAVVKVAAPAEVKDPSAGKDGLVYLGQKGRLTPAQVREGFVYRDLVRDGGEVALRSCLNGGVGGGGVGTAAPSPLVSLASARRELLVLRQVVLRGQCDMLTVMDGVCGAGLTVRALAGGDQPRARDLEVLLKAALDLIIAFRKEPGIVVT